MIEVYGKPNCNQCIFIKKKLSNNDISFEYFEDEDKAIEIAQNLQKNNKLKEIMMPLIIKEGEQIRHSDLDKYI